VKRLRSSGTIAAIDPSGSVDVLAQITDTLRGVQGDLSQVITEYNKEVYSVISSLPQGKAETRWSLTTDDINPRINNFDGDNIFVDTLASSTKDGGRFWLSTTSPNRPKTVRESFLNVYTTLTTSIDQLRAEIAAIGDANPVKVYNTSAAAGNLIESDAQSIIFDGTTLVASSGGTNVVNVTASGVTNAIHDDESGEIQAVTAKASPVSADILLIEDSAASYAKKRVTVENLFAGRGVNYFFVPTDYGAVGDGVTDDTSAINTTISAILANGGGTLYFPPGYDFLISSMTFAKDYEVEVASGSLIIIPAGQTLSIQSSFKAGAYQCFNCVSTGAVAFSKSSVRSVYPEWFGAIGDASTDCTIGIQKAIDATPTTYGVLELAGGAQYNITDIITWRDKVSALIIGNNAMIKADPTLDTTSVDMLLNISATLNLHMKDLVVRSDISVSPIECLVLLGRKTDGDGSYAGQGTKIRDCRFIGYSNTALFVNVGSEVISFDCCDFWPLDTNPAYYDSFDAPASLSSYVLDPAPSNVMKDFRNCTFINNSSTSGQDLIHLPGGATELTFFDCYFFLSHIGNVFYCYNSGAESVTSLRILHTRVEGENATGASRLVYFDTASDLRNLWISDLTWTPPSDYIVEMVNGNMNYANINVPYDFGSTVSNAKLLKINTGCNLSSSYLTIRADGGSQIFVDTGAFALYNTITTQGEDINSIFTGSGTYNWQNYIRQSMSSAYYEQKPSIIQRTIRDMVANAASHSVINGNLWKTTNSNPTTITAFTGGVTGQEITVLINDNNTTIDFTGTSLLGNGGVDWTPATGDWMTGFYDGTNWHFAVNNT
jgi:hypothetical protein